MAAPLSSWPWENLGQFKYVVYGAILAKALHTRIYEGGFKDEWCLHILIIWILRVIIYSLWSAFSNMLFLIRNYRIDRMSPDFKQIDTEWDWDNSLLLQSLIAAMACSVHQPFLENVPLWNSKAFIVCLLLHVGISEPLYYWVHKYFHTSHYLFSNYHSLHHSSSVLHPYTGANATFLEQLILTAIIGIPVIGCFLMGFGCKTMIYGYIMVFDFLTCFGHCNMEFVSYRWFQKFPFLKYILYTPSYHTLHHKEMHTNYSLFMPVFDAIWGTLNANSWEFHKTNCYRAGKEEKAPDFVFLAHIVDIMASLHAGFIARAAASLPCANFTMKMCAVPAWPFAFIGMLILWIKAKHFPALSFNLRDKLLDTWIVPRYGFHYFLPFGKDGINKLIEDAILAADRTGVKVINLAALNKNEALNGGGTLFVEKHPELKVRVVHGNTLTAAIILNEISKDVEQVFVSGATSKLGRAIALYLCQKRVRVLMLTLSAERFRKIQSEAPKEFQDYLVHVTTCEGAQNCKTWIVGKWITPWEQSWAPKGTHFHQFVIPPIIQFRRDCTYGDLSAMRLPDHLVQGLGSCWHTMDRGVVHACHAGGIVHMLEGWSHHEVGAVEVDKIDLVWNAALKHGFKPVKTHPPPASLPSLIN